MTLPHEMIEVDCEDARNQIYKEMRVPKWLRWLYPLDTREVFDRALAIKLKGEKK